MVSKRFKHRLRRGLPVLLPLGVAALLVAGLSIYLHGHTFAVLQPRGVIADSEKRLLLAAAALSLLVVVPVFVLLGYIAWKYRASNTRAKYNPEWHGGRWLEASWWLIPGVLIFILSFITWTSTHHLDPNKALAAKQSTTIQVVALDWKWLFIYPDSGVASINEVHVPVGSDVDFTITADAPMNSFWIPQLGGQIYAMPGMVTHLHLSAAKAGTYLGRSANLSGDGFSSMQFRAIAESPADYAAWSARAQTAPVSKLSQPTYDQLAQPSKAVPVTYYKSTPNNLFVGVVNKYMSPTDNTSMDSMEMAQ